MIRSILSVLTLSGVLVCAGCYTLPPVEQVDLTSAGWTTHRGQAVWRFGKRAPEVVGEMIVAVHEDGRLFVEFNKSLVTVATAQTDSVQWVLDLPMFDRRLSGRGAPSDRFALFQFDEILTGTPPAGDWDYTTEAGNWRLANPKTGEYVEGYWEQ